MFKTKQEIFNIVYRGLSRQNFQQSISKRSGGCAYRGIEGMKCAVGHLIPDAFYEEEFDDRWTPTSIRQRPEILNLCGISPEHMEFVSNIQYAHDMFSGKHMKAQLIKIGKRHKLHTP